MPLLVTPFHAFVLGIVEGLTEFLPVSSTGHLILASKVLGIDGEDAGVKAFEVVIQAGALLAVIGYYWGQVGRMARGLMGRDPEGLRLATLLLAAFMPAAIVGLLADKAIKRYLFGPWPVVAALALGGVAMIAVEFWRVRRAARPGGELAGVPTARTGLGLEAMTLRAAVIIGCCQCLAMWPGTSRSMTTIVAALLLGFSPRAAAEFSFLLALPTLGAATLHDFAKDGGAILHAAGMGGLAVGFVTSMIVAWLAVKGLLAWLNRHGLIPFGVYRVLAALAFVVIELMPVPR